MMGYGSQYPNSYFLVIVMLVRSTTFSIASTLSSIFHEFDHHYLNGNLAESSTALICFCSILRYFRLPLLDHPDKNNSRLELKLSGTGFSLILLKARHLVFIQDADLVLYVNVINL